MGDVRLWADAPTNDGHDTGIDIVAKDDISSSLTGEPRYAGYVIVSASDFSKNAIAHAEQTGTLLITPEKMDESNVDWNGFIDEGGRTNRETFDLREHQHLERAFSKAVEKAIESCENGKTPVQNHFNETVKEVVRSFAAGCPKTATMGHS